MKLLYPCTTDEALNLLRTKMRPDLLRHDASGSTTFYTDRAMAQRKAMERHRASKDKQEMALVAIELSDPGLFAELCAAEHTTPSGLQKPDGTVVLSSKAQSVLARDAQVSLEIVPGTENWLATYGGRAPECGVGIGPWK